MDFQAIECITCQVAYIDICHKLCCRPRQFAVQRQTHATHVEWCVCMFLNNSVLTLVAEYASPIGIAHAFPGAAITRTMLATRIHHTFVAQWSTPALTTSARMIEVKKNMLNKNSIVELRFATRTELCDSCARTFEGQDAAKTRPMRA